MLQLRERSFLACTQESGRQGKKGAVFEHRGGHRTACSLVLY